jgi:hypothetical protein
VDMLSVTWRTSFWCVDLNVLWGGWVNLFVVGLVEHGVCHEWETWKGGVDRTGGVEFVIVRGKFEIGLRVFESSPLV